MSKLVRIQDKTADDIAIEAEKHKKPGKYVDWVPATVDEVINIWQGKSKLFDLFHPDKPFTIDLDKFQKLAGEIGELTKQEANHRGIHSCDGRCSKLTNKK